MREHVSRDKKTTTGFSIPSLKHPVRGFGLDSSEATPPTVPLVQPLNKPPGHHISRISLRPQAKLTVNQPGDIFEQEADSVAQKVMRRLNNNSVNSQSILRQEAPQEEEELQMKPLSSSITSLQRQQVPAEEEELQMKSVDNSTLQRQQVPEEEEEVQMKSVDNSTLQRQQVPEEEEEVQMKSVDNSTLQRQQVPEEEEELQMKSLSNSTLQRQQVPEEEEEVQMKSVDNSTLQRQQVPEEEEEVQMKSVDNSTLQRQQVPEEEEELQMKSLSNFTLQRQASGGGMAASSELETSIQQARGGGQPLSDEIKQPMEQAFGADFGGVKIHTDSQSDQLNQSIQARAFTTGNDIFFRQGEYNPGSNSGKELLAHELTHVVQQNGSAVQRKILPNLETKENKIQTKVANSGNSPASESQENSQKKTLDDSPWQSQQVNSQGKTETAESQSQATSKKGSITDTPPANGNGTTPNAPPANQGGKPTGNPSDAQNQDNPQSAGQGDKQSKPEQLRGQQANADLAGVGAGGEVGGLPEANAGIPGGDTGTEAVVDDGQKAPASAEDDPAFKEVINNTRQVAGKQKEHAPATSKAEAAQGAAEPPGNEVDSKAQANQVGEMEQAPTPGFDAAAFKAKLMERIADMAPKTLEEADEFKNNNKLDSVKGELSGKVKEEQKASQGQLEEKTKEQPDTSGIEAKQVTPLPQTEPGTPPAGVNAEQAAPKSKGQGEVEAPLQAESQKLDQQMQEADITEEQLAKSNEPEFQGALAAKKDAQTHAVEAPPQYRQQEQGILANAQATAEATAQQHLQAMHGIRTQNLNQVAEQQVGAKGKDEQARAKVAGDINKIYEATKAKVEKTLSELDGQVIQAFDAGAADAKKAFEDYVGKRMDDYKSDRYSGFWGPGKWLKDKLFGMPSEVNAFYQEGRDLYIQQMDGVINKVVAIISKGLTQAKAEIASGKQEIQNYVNKLPQDLQGVGQQAAADIDSKFEELQQSVDNKQDELIDTLAQKYKENLDAVDARIEEMKAANKGLIQKAFDFVVGVIKTIIELTKMLLEVLARVASVVGQILKDPIGFLNNLIQAVKQGFLNFMKNIGKHLQAGLIGWLTGTMAEAGIEMPENFDLKGIFSLAMQLLGFTYEAIRAQAVKRLGEEKVSRMEQTVEVFKILATEGVAGIWQFVQEKIGDLNTLIIEPIKNFIIEKVITAGIEWILSLLTPASAFIKAAKAIYEIVKFFIERAQQIADLINAILDAIGAIAAGSLDQAIAGVENALAKSLPVVISFLASLLGLGGIAGKIQAIFQKLRKPMEKAVDWVIDKGAKAFKFVGNKFNNSKVGKKFNAAKDKAQEKYKAGKQWVEDKKAAGQQWVEGKKKAVKDKFGKFGNKVKDKLGFGKDQEKENKESTKQKESLTTPKVGFKDAAGENHSMWLQKNGKRYQLMVASGEPKEVKDSVKTGGQFEDINGQQESQVISQANQVEQLAQESSNDKMPNSAQIIKSKMNEVATNLAQGGDANLKGALAAYRGIHFKATWDEKQYQSEVEKEASKIVGQPEASQATREVAKSLLRKDEFTIEELESAGEIVRENLETLKHREAVELGTNSNKLDKDAQKQAYKRLMKRLINEPTSEQLNQEIEMVKEEMLSPRSRYMRPITRGSEGKGTKDEFENMFYVAIHQYVANKKQFLAELKNVETGRYRGLKFTQIPFISTSKVAEEAAKYAFGKAQDPKDVRTEGVVGRLFVYVFSVEEQAKLGALNIERLHKDNKISRSTWLINEAEVAFTGTIPGKNLVGYHNAESGQTPETLGTQAEQTARKEATKMGGLREWDA